jgi:hypothetical protein
LLTSNLEKNLKVDIIEKDTLVKGTKEELEKLAKDLKEVVNYARRMIFNQTKKIQPIDINEELLPHWLSSAFANNPNFQ